MKLEEAIKYSCIVRRRNDQTRKDGNLGIWFAVQNGNLYGISTSYIEDFLKCQISFEDKLCAVLRLEDAIANDWEPLPNKVVADLIKEIGE